MRKFKIFDSHSQYVHPLPLSLKQMLMQISGAFLQEATQNKKQNNTDNSKKKLMSFIDILFFRIQEIYYYPASFKKKV